MERGSQRKGRITRNEKRVLEKNNVNRSRKIKGSLAKLVK